MVLHSSASLFRLINTFTLPPSPTSQHYSLPLPPPQFSTASPSTAGSDKSTHTYTPISPTLSYHTLFSFLPSSASHSPRCSSSVHDSSPVSPGPPSIWPAALSGSPLHVSCSAPCSDSPSQRHCSPSSFSPGSVAPPAPGSSPPWSESCAGTGCRRRTSQSYSSWCRSGGLTWAWQREPDDPHHLNQETEEVRNDNNEYN